MKGQGIGEYVLILVLVAVVVIAILAVAGPSIDRLLNNTSACYTHDANSMECIQERMDACLKTERYSKNQCVILIGGVK